MSTRKIGIIICDRYHRCAGGKCFRSVRNREGAFARYEGLDIEVVGFTTCDGCPGGNVEYAVDEMMANGADVVHLATATAWLLMFLSHQASFIIGRLRLKWNRNYAIPRGLEAVERVNAGNKEQRQEKPAA